MITSGPALAPASGTRKVPGPGANAATGTFPGLYDPWRAHAADSAFLRASDGFIITREHDDPARPPDHLPASALFPDAYDTWLDHVWPAAACAHPIRLTGQLHRLDAATGEILSTLSTDALPDRVIYKACGNRRAGSCPACAETYRRDAFHLIRSGLIGGKGVSPAVAAHPAVFATFTAPSFGPVHTRPVRRHHCPDRADCRCQPEPCHARHDGGPVCPHGRTLACWTRHPRTDPALGQPLCLECYDHHGQVVWNHYAGELWRRTKQAIERRLGQLACRRGLFVWVADSRGRRRRVPLIRLSHGKAAEYQHRGVVHFHGLLRLDGYHPARPDAVFPPPPGITVADLEDAVRHAAATIAYTTPAHPERPEGWRLAWGGQLDVRIISMSGAATVTDLAVASYLAKYATKGTEVTGHASARITPATADLYANPQGSHTERLIHACWTLGRDPAWWKLRRWAHMLGFGGQFFTKSGHYSLRFADLRAARITYRRHQDPGPEHAPIRTADHTGEETILIVGTLTYSGTGWRTTGDALLANTAADQARKRRQAGREELADEHNSTASGQHAA